MPALTLQKGNITMGKENTAEPLEESDVISVAMMFEQLDESVQNEILALLREILNK
jgi:hypothetical protein